MAYQFQSENFGRCQLRQSTSGKHGFGLPKLFVIESIDEPTLGQFTYRYADTVISGLQSVIFANAVLCRIAISQFIECSRFQYEESIEPLDLTFEPYAGQVLNAKGTVLTWRRLHSPRETQVTCR